MAVSEGPPPGLRFKLGVGFFVAGWACPLLIPVVTATNLSTEWKAAISGLLLVGAPEVFSLVCIALLGKAGFTYIKHRAFALFKRAAPKAKVSRARYRFGLVLWALLALFSLFIYYAPDLIPGYDENRTAMNLVADGLFIASFFILGGDFWEKFRALFIYEAKAIIPGGNRTDLAEALD